MKEKTMSILEHLEELRKVLLVSIGALIPASAVGWFFRERLLQILIEPVNAQGQKLVYIAMTEAFIAQMKIAIIAGFIIASPIIFWQVWSFILPALRAHEKRYLMLLVPVSILLFAGGVIFAYTTIFKFGIRFFLEFATEGLTPMLTLSKYLTFTFWFLLPFGLMFELPLVMFFLAKLGIVNYRFLARNRKFALLIIFAVSAVVTPTTDLVTQTAMAVPMYILYEISIWIVRFVKPRAGYEWEVDSAEPVDTADDAAETESIQTNTGTKDQKLEDIYRNITERGNPDKTKE